MPKEVLDKAFLIGKNEKHDIFNIIFAGGYDIVNVALTLKGIEELEDDI